MHPIGELAAFMSQSIRAVKGAASEQSRRYRDTVLMHILRMNEEEMTKPLGKPLTRQQKVKKQLGVGEHIVILTYQGRKTEALVTIRTKGCPRITVHKTQTAVGLPSLVTFTLNGDELTTPKASLSTKDISAFKERIAANPPTQDINLD
jgi:hypothetical protein